MSCERRLLVVGWDGATFDLLDSLIDRGLMPNLDGIMREGFRSTLLSTMPPISAPAWSTLITGMNPGQHGILNFVDESPPDSAGLNRHVEEPASAPVEVFPGGYSVINATRIHAPTLWQRLTSAGKEIGVMNMPMTYPPEPVKGFMITGMLTPPGASDYTYPSALRSELDDYEIELELGEREFDFPPVQFISRTIEIAQKRGRTALRLMRERAWDAFFVVFTGTDRIQHRFWNVLAPRAVAGQTSVEERELLPLLHEYYKLLDSLLGEMLSVAGQDALTMVMSDHGFGPIGDRSVHRRVLARMLGLQSAGSRSWPVRIRSFAESRLGVTWPRVRRVLARVAPRSWLQYVERNLRAREAESQQKELGTIVPFVGHLGGIRFNRDAFGDRPMAEFRDQIAGELTKLVDPRTGENLVANVWPGDALYHGELAATCPDLVFALNPTYVLAGGVGRNRSLVGPRTSHPLLQGSHRRDGILIASGPGVRPDSSGEARRLEDVTATIMAHQKLPVPKQFDGRPIEEALGGLEWVLSSGETESRRAGFVANGAWTSEEEMSAVVERLRGIGYLE